MEKEGNNESLNIKSLIKPYARKWYLFLISIVILATLAILYIKYTQPVYKVKTSVLVKDTKKMSSSAGDFGLLQGLSGLTGMGTNSIENELEVFMSKKFADEVVKDLGLQTSIFSREKYYDVELYKETSPFFVKLISEKQDEDLPKKPLNILVKGGQIIISSEELKSNIKTTFGKVINFPFADFIIVKNPNYNARKTRKMLMSDLYFTFTDFENASYIVQKDVKVDLADKDATIIELSLGSSNREKAKDILNSFVNIYNNDAINDKNIESKKSKDFIDNRIALIGNELSDVENEKQRFKERNKIADIPTEVKLNLTKNAEIDKEVTDVNSKLELTKMLYSFLRSQSTSQVLPSNIIGDDNPSVSSNISSYNKLVIERNRLLESGTPDNPVIKELTSQIGSLRNSLNESLIRSQKGYEIARSNLLSKMSEVDNDISSVPNQEKVFRSIERNQKLKESLYLLLLEKREEAAISLAMTANKARVIDKAYALLKPEAPKKMYALLGALALGFILPFGFIYYSELTNSKIISREDLEKLSDINVLSEIPRLSKGAQHLIQNNDLSPFAEAFRILMTNLKFLTPKKSGASVILVTSSVKGEGKTFISMNLALTIANSNNKVLIIGSDIRNPQLQRYNENSKNFKGLTEFLIGDVLDFNDIIQKDAFTKNCDVIYSGIIPPNPTMILENGKYRELLNLVRDSYDYIFIDSAPLMLVTDTFLLAKEADITLYVTRSEITEKSFVKFANKNYEQGKLVNATFVLNDVRKSNFGYGNTYGYGYHANNQKKWWQFF